MINYFIFLQRILEILEADTTLGKKVLEFTMDDLEDNMDNEKNTRSYPLICVTTSPNLDVSQRIMFSQGNPNKIGIQKRTLEFWVIVMVKNTTSVKIQEQLYEIVDLVEKIFENNIQLKKPVSNDDRLCSYSKIFTQKSLEKYSGHMVKSITIVIRPDVIVG